MEDATLTHPLSQPSPPASSTHAVQPSSSSSSSQPSLPITDPVIAFLGEEVYNEFQPTRNKSLSLHDVSMDANGLKMLADNDLWKEVLKLCERCFQAGFAPHEVLQYRLTHLVALLRLRLYEFAGAQCDSLGNLQKNASYFYQSYPSIYKDKTGNMAPFSLEVMKALVPQFRGQNRKAQDQLYRLLFRCIHEMQKLDPSNADEYGVLKPSKRTMDMRKDRLHQFNRSMQQGSAIAVVADSNGGGEKKNGSLGRQQQTGGVDQQQRQQTTANSGDTGLADESESVGTRLELWKLREKRLFFLIINCHVASLEYHLALQLMEKALGYWGHDLALQSLLGALYLQAGIISKAGSTFNEVERITREQNSDPATDVRCCLNRGFMHFAENRFQEAYEQFDHILSNMDEVNVVAANGKSVCLLYLRRLSDAIASLEDVIRKDPVKALTETLVYNLCTLYDLESDQSMHKKRIIRSLVLRYCPDDFPVSALKLV